MSDRLTFSTTLTHGQGDRGTYHLVIIRGETAEAIAMHARLQRLEFGTRRGFGSVRVLARIGGTAWNTSVFPQKDQSEWILLIGRKVMRAEDLAEGDAVALELDLA